MAKTTNTSHEHYLLVLENPVNSVPVGLYDTAQDALNAAATFGLPTDTLDITGSEPNVASNELADRIDATSIPFNDLGVRENRKPKGYIIIRFVGTAPKEFAMVEPYTNRDYKLPEDEKPDTIDPDQTLIW